MRPYILSTAFQNPRGQAKRLDREQYARLLTCSQNGDIRPWNDWRDQNPHQRICLESADLRNTSLQRANFRGACLTNARLEGADLYRADLRSAWLQTAFVDGCTSFWKVVVDRHTPKNVGTNVRGLAVDSVRIDAATRQLLEYNIRRMNWEEWYRRGTVLRVALCLALVRPFWLVSDYGRSALRVLLTLLGLAGGFALVYSTWPELVSVEKDHLRGFLHALYFSVVTMTTLGFGDIHANPSSPAGQLLVMTQSLLGYFLLGAVLTRLNVLFTSGGPSASFER